MNVVSEIPVGFVVLRGQTVGVHRRPRSPAVNLGQGEILVNKRYSITIFLEQLRKQGLVHAGAEWALEVVEIDHHDFGILFSPSGPAADIDLLHHFSIW